MIKREQLDEIENIIRDLRMALDFKENMDKDEPFVVLPMREPVTIVFDKYKKKEVNTRISILKKQLKEKLNKLLADISK